MSMLVVYGVADFRFLSGSFLFWIVFSFLLLPLEVRTIPSDEIVANLGVLVSSSIC
ncbi:hypothetical protein [Rhodospirillum sp. A1_3_36]|uniref:hypothetical protein n=1 Tax=Rhodospirillum sp. A1_3_36 TaxID=3391666 RepID=UPI0039A71A6E